LILVWQPQQIAIGLAVGTALLLIMFHWTPAGEVLDLLTTTDLAWAAVACSIYVVDIGLRTMRWRGLLWGSSPLSFPTCLRALLVGYGLNILLPARVGELARVEYLKFTRGVNRSTVLPSVLAERAMDGIVVVVALAIGLVVAGRQPGV